MHFNGAAVAFATLGEPGGQRRGKSLGRDAEAGFDLSFRDGERIVKFGGVREITHAEAVQPLERACPPFSNDDDFDVELLRVHAKSIADSPFTAHGGAQPGLHMSGEEEAPALEEDALSAKRSSVQDPK